MRNGRQGEWRVPSRKDRSFPASGTKCLINRWGDTSMGIGLGRERDVAQVMIARHGGAGIEAEAVRAAEGIPLVMPVVEELRDISKRTGIAFD